MSLVVNLSRQLSLQATVHSRFEINISPLYKKACYQKITSITAATNNKERAKSMNKLAFQNKSSGPSLSAYGTAFSRFGNKQNFRGYTTRNNSTRSSQKAQSASKDPTSGESKSASKAQVSSSKRTKQVTEQESTKKPSAKRSSSAKETQTLQTNEPKQISTSKSKKELKEDTITIKGTKITATTESTKKSISTDPSLQKKTTATVKKSASRVASVTASPNTSPSKKELSGINIAMQASSNKSEATKTPKKQSKAPEDFESPEPKARRKASSSKKLQTESVIEENPTTAKKSSSTKSQTESTQKQPSKDSAPPASKRTTKKMTKDKLLDFEEDSEIKDMIFQSAPKMTSKGTKRDQYELDQLMESVSSQIRGNKTIDFSLAGQGLSGFVDDQAAHKKNVKSGPAPITPLQANFETGPTAMKDFKDGHIPSQGTLQSPRSKNRNLSPPPPPLAFSFSRYEDDGIPDNPYYHDIVASWISTFHSKKELDLWLAEKKRATLAKIERKKKQLQLKRQRLQKLKEKKQVIKDAKAGKPPPPPTEKKPVVLQVHTFDWRTFRYKDLVQPKPEYTLPIRASDAKSKFVRTSDLQAEEEEIPAGLSAPVVSYAQQIIDVMYNTVLQEKGEDVVVINIEKKSNWLPVMIIASGLSGRHCLAIANRVKAELKRKKLVGNAKIESNIGDEWVIVSCSSAILEILTHEQREEMELERLWVLKRSSQETFEYDREEEKFMYDEEDGMWDDEDF